jgi:S1-C subfamily serine protease
MNDKHKYLLIYITTVLVVVASLGYYNYHTTNLLEQNFNVQLTTLESDIVSSLKTLNNNLDKSTQDLTDSINSQNILFNNMLNNVKKENDDNIKSVVELIETTEAENTKKLSALKNDLSQDISNIQLSSNDFSGIVNEIIKSAVSVLTDRGQGSGAFITGSGHIITNDHVISGASQIRVLTHDKLLRNAQLIGTDPSSDIAVLKITNTSYPRLRFEESSNVRVGEKVIAVGNPGGFDFTVTEGIVSAVNRKTTNNHLYVQTDVPINPGNSGGPLVNTKGRIVGINNFKIKGFEGVGFALQADTANEVSDQIIDQFG